jgi:hypothetical protein
MAYNEITIDGIKGLDNEFSKSYHVIYINYDKKNGVKIKDSIAELSEDLDSFYELYLFNEEKMIRVFNIDDNEYKYEEVSISENYEEKQLLIDNSILTKIDSSLNYDTVKVRVADDKYQYIGLGRKEG